MLELETNKRTTEKELQSLQSGLSRSMFNIYYKEKLIFSPKSTETYQ